MIAQVDVDQSNSIIESWWRSLRHGWLYQHALDTFGRVKDLVAFYVDQHNQVMPHAAFKGQTPNEVYFGTGDKVPERLAEQRTAARTARIKKNRAVSCGACPYPAPATQVHAPQ